MVKRIVSGTVLALILISIVPLPCNIQPVKGESGNVIATYGKGYLEDVDGLLVLHVKGSPYEMGYQYGFLLRDNIQASIQSGIQYWADMFGYSYEYFVTLAQAIEPCIPQEYIQEMQGLADGADMNYIDVLIYQALPDVAFVESLGGCSGFAVFGDATVEGHLYHGRNGDFCFPPEMIPLVIGLVIVYQPDNGNAYVSFSDFGTIKTFDGMNNQGMTVGMKGSTSTDVAPHGMPFGLMLKQVLQYSNNIAEAIDIICQTPRTSGWNILIGDSKAPDAAAVEISASYCKVFWAGDSAEDMEPHYSIPNLQLLSVHLTILGVHGIGAGIDMKN
jgi:isopenicillin-N N-acyltransferase-like protein